VRGHGLYPRLFLLPQRKPLQAGFLLLIMLPFWVSFIIRTMSWINIMGDSGLINHFLLENRSDRNAHIHAVQ
jgi:spermidine/putrescine transport system permease protein